MSVPASCWLKASACVDDASFFSLGCRESQSVSLVPLRPHPASLAVNNGNPGDRGCDFDVTCKKRIESNK